MTESTHLQTLDSASGPAPPALSQKQRQWKRNVVLGLLLLAALTSGFMLAQGLAASGSQGKKESSPQVLALLLMSHQQPRLWSDSHVQAKGAEDDLAAYAQTQEALVTSRMVLSKALRNPDVAKLEIVRQQADPIDWLETHLRVDRSLSPEILRVGLSGRNQAELATVVNAVVQTFLAELVNDEMNARRHQLNELENSLGRIKDEILTGRQSLTHLANLLRIMPQFEVSVKQQQLSEYAREATRVSIAKVAAQAKLNRADAALRNKLNDEIAELDEQQRGLQEEMRKIRDEVRNSLETNTEVELRRNDLREMEATSKKVKSEIKALKLELQSPRTRISVLQPASAPDK